jgi:carbon-monoxide dehydrogenase large subunit
MLRDILGAPADKVRVLTGNVGGSFGMKAAVYPEYVCILHGARALGRPVKWTDERSGSFMSDHHGRDHDMTVEVAFDKGGLIQAVRANGYGNLGGYCSAFGPLLPTLNLVKNIISMYRTPLLEVSTLCVFSNTTLVSAYRGAGRPEGAFCMERMMDYAAAQLGIDRFELRKRNFIKAREMPFAMAAGMTYDCGDFPGLFKDAVERAVQSRLVQVTSQHGVRAVTFDIEIHERLAHDLTQITSNRDPIAVRAHVASDRTQVTGARTIARTVLRALLFLRVLL